ncbi:glycoside hydrolase [Pseudomonas petrae]|uniref:Glycoside hydrolase n=1 Tax=Pseudomonas petrae TaxID=2912190 RepID=A0ABS9I8H2_9PSED|nr:glycoside hydrolase [Pseudomonas petrae]MCF7534145.1 glycoside hydrolase [Pseudomonas petrae]MCF7538005.1 glycoside hydrolase [Pseudomonas petrae]MCF7543351.1 glycoside hydrolase [Pseudomonas petrae]MCF7555352.1 glycoside hydrolase [Pseudomonas petrae]
MSFISVRLCVCLLLGWLLPFGSSAETLENAFWRVDIDPQTLAVRVSPSGQSALQASSGVKARRVSALKTTPEHLSWQWDEGAWHLEARLQQRDLLLTIKARSAGVLEFLNQPGDAMGKALIWPMAEGHYVPRGDTVWQQFLVAQGEINTTQDLSLPLWGMDHGAFTLTWLLTNPFNNRLRLHPQGEALRLSASHAFTALDVSVPLTFRLSLDAPDPLAGARRYRQWLIDNGEYQTLQSKFEKTPEGRKLLGAAHVYLWGNDLLALDDIQSWERLTQVLASDDPLAVQLRKRLDKKALVLLSGSHAQLQLWQRVTLLRSLNNAFNSVARQAWQRDAQPGVSRLVSRYGELRGEVARLFAGALADDPSTWGGALSLQGIKSLQASGLSRLWLGLGEGWEGGLWHPEAVRAGVQAGYLIAPYDSYETALATHENSDWVTAHLGSDAYRQCAIVLKDGTFKAGFQQSGHYTDPRCVRPLMEARVAAVQAAAGFNSWFLDAYATGMLFDSYRPGATMTQMQNAGANVSASQWLAEAQALPSGSEDGNAVTARGILFAHGMQTPVIGWGDPELSQHTSSRWYLGSWYPPEQPDVFFKPVPIKEPYRTVHFNPTTRLPLYQTVFHGSVITAHHWLFDSLKLVNVRQENELTQLLYNVPPLYHLSSGTLGERLPVIQRQDRFFRPLHERLGTQAMTAFSWLTRDRLVQQTTFADGTRLVANFDGKPRELGTHSFAGHSVTAVGPDGAVSVYHATGEGG